MPQYTDLIARPELRPLLEAVVSLIDWPAAIVADGEEVIISNEQWRRFGSSSDESRDSDRHFSIRRSLQGFTKVDELIEKLQSGEQDTGAATMRYDVDESSKGKTGNEYEVRWRLVPISSQYDSLALITLLVMPDVKSTTNIAEPQQARIDRLLIRQTLIEETERRRLGRALHDVVVQDLAQVRAAVRTSGITAEGLAKIITSVDRIIDEVRTLTFDLGPPVLEDLGLTPALEWLAEHLSERYSANISLADDECAPRLSKPTRTIVFRTVRELVINAAKHAPGAEIVISCITNHGKVRITIRDTGPGFDTSRIHDNTDGIHNYGLLSVEQQIRGVGGAFDIFSEIGEGTRATITVPLELE